MFWFILSLYIIIGIIVVIIAIKEDFNHLQYNIDNVHYYAVGTTCLGLFVLYPIIIPFAAIGIIALTIYGICLGLRYIGIKMMEGLGYLIVNGADICDDLIIYMIIYYNYCMTWIKKLFKIIMLFFIIFYALLYIIIGVIISFILLKNAILGI